MKIYIYTLVIAITVLFLFSGCLENDRILTSDEEPLLYLKSSLGGCNHKTEENISSDEEKCNTVIVHLLNDTLIISVGLNYACCTPFITDCSVKQDSILISITDTCPDEFQ